MSINNNYTTTPIALTSQFYFCGIPFRADTYRGCSHGCRYCFASTRKAGAGFGADFKPSYAQIKYFEKLFKNAFGTKSRSDINVEALRHKLPLHLGGMSDPFQHKEKRLGITYEFLKLLREYDYPVVISTKNNMFLSDKYMKILSSMKVVMQISIIDSNNLPALEPYASSIEHRFDAVKKCWDVNIPCHIRLQPFTPGLMKDVDEYIKKVRDTGCRFVTIEHLKLPLDYSLIRKISNALGYDIKDAMSRLTGFGLETYGREFELPAAIKYDLLLKDGGIVDILHKNGIRYGAGDNQLHHYNDAGTCCGIDLYNGFENFFKANYTYMMTSQPHKKYFTFDDLLGNHWLPQEEINVNMNRSSKWNENNKCRYLTGNNDRRVPDTVYFHLRNKFHNPDLNDSPRNLYLIRTHVQNSMLYDKVLGAQTNINDVVYEKIKPKKDSYV